MTRLGALLLLLCVASGCAIEETQRADFPLPAFGSPPPEVAAGPAPIVQIMPGVPGTTPMIEHPEAIAPLHAALTRTVAEGTVTRISHLGDSSIGMDDLPHVLRTAFQSRFGDAGPGFVLLQPHSSSYINRTVSLRNDAEWEELCFIARRCLRDGHYGLGGVSFSSHGGARTTIVPRGGRVLSRAELWYVAQPSGGELTFRFGPDRVARISTRAPSLEDRWHVLTRDTGTDGVQVTATGGGSSRAFGVVLENDGPGVVWDSLSMIGAFTHRILEHDEAHFAAQLAHRDPDLVVLSYGGNDLRRVSGGIVDEAGLSDETFRLLDRVRRAVPDAGCLVLGIIDHERSGARSIAPEFVEVVVRAQRAAAERAGCGFWDNAAAMGGAGSFAEWRRLGLAAADGKHLTPRGRRVVGARLFEAIMYAGGPPPTAPSAE